MAMHDELGRDNIQLLADVFTDFHQSASALATGATLWLVMMIDSGQLLG
jgi:hypothetical protein